MTNLRIITLAGCCLSFAMACAAVQPPASGRGDTQSGGADLGARCGGDFGVEASAQKLESFLSASADFMTTAAELEGSLLSACTDMGKELGVPEAEMQPRGGEAPVKSACAAASAKLQSELQGLRAEAKLKLDVVATPPRCEVDMNAYAKCAGECDASVDPGKLEVECKGGEVVGECSGECKGSCHVEAEGTCGGECQGTCEGGCQGTCNGACDGKCSAKNAKGECEGKCDGTCSGTCSAKCKGECKGECWVEGKAACVGECKGGCSVAYTEPRCTGEVEPPKVEAQCQASCDAKLSARAKCEPGQVKVAMSGKVDSNVEERAAKVRAALEGGFGTILAARAKLERLHASGSAMVRMGGEVPGAVGNLGLSAAACATQAAAGIVRASASVSVSIEASASVSGAASAG
jgi:hypothetical protein